MLFRFNRRPGRSSNPGRFYYGWVVLAALLAISTLGFGISLSFGVFFKPLLEEFNSTRAMTSGIFSVYMILGSFFAVIGGWALDRYGARIVIILMAIFTSLSLLLTSRASQPWHLFISYSLLLAVGIGPLFTITMSTVFRWFTEKRVLAIGIVGSGMGIGPVIMAPVLAWLISNYDWRTAYLIMGIIVLPIMVPCALLLKKAPIEVTTLSEDAYAGAEASKQPGNSGQDEFSIGQAVKSRSFWLLFMVWFFIAFSLMLVQTHVVPYAIDFGITPIKAASILSLTAGLSSLGRVSIARVSDKIGWKPTYIACTLLMAGAMLFLIRPANSLMFYLFAVVFGLSNGAAGPPIIAQFGNIFGLRHIGVIMGVLNVGWAIGAALGPALGGYMYDISGSYTIAFLAGMFTPLLAAVLVFLLRTPKANFEG